MESNDTRPNDHRRKTRESAAHIMEFSKADPHEKINHALNCLYADDIATVEKAIIQTLNTLNQKL